MDGYNQISLTHFAATVADLAGVSRPALADEPLEWAETVLRDLCKGPIDRLLLFNADCCAQWMFDKYPEALEPVRRHTQLTVPFRTVMPSVTPVCFGTMYTGVLPEVHGITSYAKPIITTDSLFDALLRAGKKVALLGTEDCSMTMIWKNRPMDIFRLPSEGAIVEKARDLICEDKYDVIVVYTFMYDTYDHAYGPEEAHALSALFQQTSEFDFLVSTAKRVWQEHNTLVSFSPDHGCHARSPIGSATENLGAHGTELPLDLNIMHHFGVIPSRSLAEKGSRDSSAYAAAMGAAAKEKLSKKD